MKTSDTLDSKHWYGHCTDSLPNLQNGINRLLGLGNPAVASLIPPTNFCCEEGVLTIDHEKTLQDLEGMAACFIA